MKYKYISNMPIVCKGKKLMKGDVVSLTDKELKDLPFWRFEKLNEEKIKNKPQKEVE